ncbi:MAG: alpha/beta hydrolase domain-containing protein [Alphaproteobacteria bacterium]|jgi:hypothetical protein|nr:alpha/beta hydrolase domain-containing protein [Alphaproteobacteria bacterium]
MKAWIGVLLMCLATPAWAAVERVEVSHQSAFADGESFGAAGAYEKLSGRLHYAIDPDDPANAAVVDIAHALRDADGMVRFAGDFLMLRPANPARANRRLLYEVGNRGRVGMLSFFNEGTGSSDPQSLDHAGNGFLFEQGYTLLWSGWNWDVLEGDDRLQLELPLAEGIEGWLSAEITVKAREASQPVAWGNSRGYPALDVDQADARLTVRDRQGDARREIPREQWRFAREDGGEPVADATHIWLQGGFAPGLLYEVVYRSRPVIVGLGLAAIRDAMSHFRGQESIDHALIFGISQSGRVISHMLWQGFHVDEAGGMVFDGALIHVGGAGKGSFNHRFAQTTRHGSPHEDHQYPADFFPFTTVPQVDPLNGAKGSLLDRARELGQVPKLVFTNTGGEYWTRSASLLHTDVEGERDIALADETRLYVFAGAQHGSWLIPHRAWFENCINPLDHRPPMRAVLLALDAWATAGEAPPPSAYPRLAAGELGTLDEWRAAFPAIPGLRLPVVNLRPPRLEMGPRWADGIIDTVPPGFGPAFETRVSLPDADGIARGGIRLPAAAAPLGTYTGWNLRQPRFGAGDQIDRWVGSFVPFPRDEAAGDPRLLLAARYADRAAYESAVTEAAEALVARRLLLASDVPAITARLGAFYDRVMAHDPDDMSCEYLAP